MRNRGQRGCRVVQAATPSPPDGGCVAGGPGPHTPCRPPSQPFGSTAARTRIGFRGRAAYVYGAAGQPLRHPPPRAVTDARSDAFLTYAGVVPQRASFVVEMADLSGRPDRDAVMGN